MIKINKFLAASVVTLSLAACDLAPYSSMAVYADQAAKVVCDERYWVAARSGPGTEYELEKKVAGFCREDILMEDNDILVVHKHAGMAVQNARMGQMDLEHALLNYLAKQTRAETPGQARTQIPYLAVVHRLDQPVEGVLVFAKNKDAAGKLGRQVKDGTMKKEYLAVCEGKIEKQGVQKFEDFLVKDGRSNTSRVVQPGTAGAKKAVLEYEVIRTQENRTLVQIHLGTGRHHQIRVQFSHAGYPLAGDAKYGAKEIPSMAVAMTSVSRH